MRTTQVAIVGAGPAGLAAAIEAAKAGAKVTLIDENKKPGGQLFKQIHKFFGSKEHQAGMRGYKIGEKLLEETEQLGVEVLLNSPVYGLFNDFVLGFISNNREQAIKADRIILATGASENALAFPGGTLPGVMGAGAAQTMINVHRVLPGKKILMIGSGNVGLIVSYQLMQAGAQVVGLIEGAPQIGGYEVHANKIKRAGAPVLTSHTIVEAVGRDSVVGAIVSELDEKWQTIKGSEKFIEADTICVSVGLNPLTELAWLARCEFLYKPKLGGKVPKCDHNMETSIEGLYVAGDISGVEEASSAMEEGRLAGIACAESLGLYTANQAEALKHKVRRRLDALKTGVTVKKASNLSQGIPDKARVEKGPVAYLECTQEIPCNPCEEACPVGAIKVGNPITSIPELEEEKCIGCSLCVAACPGLAIFNVHKSYTETTSSVEFPFEYFPLPSEGEKVSCVNRQGEHVAWGKVISVKTPKGFDSTPLVSVEIPKEYYLNVRSIERKRWADE